jgi:signal transduction histidine kinase
MIALPLRAGGAVVGAIGFSFDAPRRFDDAERSFFLSIAEQCGVALERARLLEDERRARAAAEQARAEADRTRAGLDALLGNAPLGIGFFDREFRFLRVNATLAAMNGAPAAAHLGKTPYEVLPPDPAVQRVEASWRRVLETGEPLLDVEVAADVPGAGGPRTWINSWYPVRSDGEIVGVGVLVREVTREREAQAFQRHVLAVVGHDLRNPLSAITFATSSLLRASPAPGQIRPLERIAGSAGRIVEIVGALLDYANVRDGGVPIRRRPCDVAEVARAVAEECQLAHPGSDVRCTGEGDSRGTWDPDRIAQVLANLVSNAIRHADRGTAVAVRCRGSDEGVAIEVENAGPAIAAEDAPRLFDPFRKGPSGGGLGLGLFIARALVDAHRGAIQVRSGGGRTVFEVRLPRR